jgi:hypothetical protein
MAAFIDARIPVSFGEPGAAAEGADGETALLVEGRESAAAPAEAGKAAAHFVLPYAPSSHPAGCACCVPLGPVAAALNRLFLARAKGEAPFFRRVVAVAGAAGQAAIRQALEADPVVSFRFRLAQEGSVVSPAPIARCM